MLCSGIREMKVRTLCMAILICVAAGTVVGCKRNVVRAAPTPVSPVLAPEPEPQPPLDLEAPLTTNAILFPLEMIPPPPPDIIAIAPQPVRPRPSAPVEPPKPKEPEPPLISPQLSAGQLAVAQRRTGDDIRGAERNLQLANGKSLNAAQQDLAEKVRGFLAQAQEAIRAADWIRAANLAQKAQILSSELLKSLS